MPKTLNELINENISSEKESNILLKDIDCGLNEKGEIKKCRCIYINSQRLRKEAIFHLIDTINMMKTTKDMKEYFQLDKQKEFIMTFFGLLPDQCSTEELKEIVGINKKTK